MANQQDHEWVEAQKIVISTDLIVAAKKHLQFLEVVDKNGNLYDGPILEKAIFRYKYCWLPLLAEHVDQSSQLPESRLVVPLDCEWIWHCHRLNPVQLVSIVYYSANYCIKLFGKILDPGCVVVSSIEGVCKKQTEEIWKKKYPEESYELDFSDHNFKNDTQINSANLPSINYDLVSSVKRQSSFYHKVSGAIFKDDLYLEEAVKRYKGFLHLVTRNMEKKLNSPCVPTYDIDLIWHTHQLYPRSYCKDVMAIAGQVLHHDDTDTDQTKGGKLDVGIKTTTQQWTEIFGSIYWRVGSRPNNDTALDMEGGHLTAMDMEGGHSTAMTARCWCISEDMRKEKSAAKCIIIPADNMEAGDKLSAKCICIATNNMEVVEKSTTRCMCIPTDREKWSAKCICIPTDNMEVGEKLSARCMCIPANNMVAGEKLSAKCICIPVDNMEVGEKSTARCMCIPADSMVAREKSTARCMCIPADNMEAGYGSSAKTARCWCISEHMDGQKVIVESIASGAIKV
ncbi:hypothetical protein L1987_13739 [Smallanthus sonchifolius]|uniref:Uncharacterized protein n=1 Tax=Smallanthus sonchifolius TaxID=185202 RepID=A0ACB9JJL4_9ASTR|nr:hypothetical protein L1987_13739 [Smallanthus sonchifolius]